MTEDEITDDLKQRGKLERGFILGRDQTFWAQFVTPDRKLDVERLKQKRRYRDEQLDYIRAEMIKNGWILAEDSHDEIIDSGAELPEVGLIGIDAEPDEQAG